MPDVKSSLQDDARTFIVVSFFIFHFSFSTFHHAPALPKGARFNYNLHANRDAPEISSLGTNKE
jgi:hypothetical protein